MSSTGFTVNNFFWDSPANLPPAPQTQPSTDRAQLAWPDNSGNRFTDRITSIFGTAQDESHRSLATIAPFGSEGLCKETYDQLAKSMVVSSHPKNSKWIAQDDLKRLWTNERLKRFSDHYKWNLRDDEQKLIQSNFIKVLSLLLWIEWDAWHEFPEKFLRRHGEHACSVYDSHLPLAQEDKQELEKYMSAAKAGFFIGNQYIFLPFVIREGTNVTLKCGDILPFLLEEHSRIGHGASSEVFKETIPAGYFQWEKKGKNEEPFSIARKVVRDETAANEIKCAKLFLDSIQNHKYVFRNLAVFVEDQCHHLLYPLADTNLHGFLHDNKYAMSLDAPGSFARIMPKIARLAHALRYLHQEIRDPETGKIGFCHMDFRPSNILVTDTARDYEFNISDLGLSVFKENTKDDQGLNQLESDNTSKTRGRRPPGRYEAPEMGHLNYVGRKSDVWSLACMVITILSRVILGKVGMVRFDDERLAKSKDCGYDYYYIKDTSGMAKLNEAVESWLSEFEAEEGRFANKLTVDLGLEKSLRHSLCSVLRGALIILEKDRITADDFLKGLDTSCRSLRLKDSRLVARNTDPMDMDDTPEEASPQFLRQFDQADAMANLTRGGVSQIRATTTVKTAMNAWLQSADSSSLLVWGERSFESSCFASATKCLWTVANDNNHAVFACLRGSTSGPPVSAEPFVYLVQCLIIQLRERHLHEKRIFDSKKLLRLVTEEWVLSTGVEIICQLLSERTEPCIILIDDFKFMYSEDQGRDCKQYWQQLLAALGCWKDDTSRAPKNGLVKVLIRTSGNFGPLQRLGFNGKRVDGKDGRPSLYYHSFLECTWLKKGIISREDGFLR